MILFPNAKINLGLQIIKKRTDGYHEIITCLYPIPLYDALEMVMSKKTTFTSTGLEIPGNANDNLILKALKLLRKDFSELPHVDIHLHKAIPMGAGLGGGSADAAFALRLLNNLFDLHFDNWFLESYAEQLGSDCPFFVDNRPKIATRKGEVLEEIPLDLTGKWLVLVNPSLHVGTKEAYQGVVPANPSQNLKETLSEPSVWKEHLVNDFEKSIFLQYPSIAKIKKELYESGAFYAAMSGSGATVFGLYDAEPELPSYPSDYFIFKKKL